MDNRTGFADTHAHAEKEDKGRPGDEGDWAGVALEVDAAELIEQPQRYPSRVLGVQRRLRALPATTATPLSDSTRCLVPMRAAQSDEV
eukprot:2359037-Rhodomonas_salina.1